MVSPSSAPRSRIKFYIYVLIEGANEDHHTVRYETWWQDFIEKFFLLEERCKIEALQQEEEIVTLRVEA
jgi:hypothetical protein